MFPADKMNPDDLNDHDRLCELEMYKNLEAIPF